MATKRAKAAIHFSVEPKAPYCGGKEPKAFTKNISEVSCKRCFNKIEREMAKAVLNFN